ncbi:hypothetical protein RHMOL_Rhmol13G0228100 [Rhododendron molle]|uniref:Uncharacterized protein n=1 Tax=Rhododendron molle TaxID=49168 RepID=A0ACC0LA30_RHOML|nr:hypothetical protein RHMOL_Rhmol13G0228100 [Rhododendron molle]
MSSTTNIEVALPHRDRRGRLDYLVSIQGLLDEILAKLHHLRAEHRWKGVQLNKMLVLLSEIQDGQQQQLETMEYFLSSQQQYYEKMEHFMSKLIQRFPEFPLPQ